MAARLIALVVFIALIGWDVWEAVGNLLGLPAYYTAMGVEESTPWVLLVTGLVVAIVLLVVGVVLGWKRHSVVEASLIYVLALAVQSTTALSLIAAEQAWRAEAILGILE